MPLFHVIDVLPYRGYWQVLTRFDLTKWPHRAAALLHAEQLAKGTDSIIFVRNENDRTDQVIVYQRGKPDREVSLTEW